MYQNIRKALDNHFMLSRSHTACNPFVIVTVLDPLMKEYGLFTTVVHTAT